MITHTIQIGFVNHLILSNHALNPDMFQLTPSFEAYVQANPVVATIIKELRNSGSSAIIPLNIVGSDGGVDAEEVQHILELRKGRVLTAGTILKSDFFSGLQKAGLSETVDGVSIYAIDS